MPRSAKELFGNLKRAHSAQADNADAPFAGSGGNCGNRVVIVKRGCLHGKMNDAPVQRVVCGKMNQEALLRLRFEFELRLVVTTILRMNPVPRLNVVIAGSSCSAR